jgi:hypothetical protein
MASGSTASSVDAVAVVGDVGPLAASSRARRFRRIWGQCYDFVYKCSQKIVSLHPSVPKPKKINLQCRVINPVNLLI